MNRVDFTNDSRNACGWNLDDGALRPKQAPGALTQGETPK